MTLGTCLHFHKINNRRFLFTRQWISQQRNNTSRNKITRCRICFAVTIIVLLVGTALRSLIDPTFPLPSKTRSKNVNEETPSIRLITRAQDEAEVAGNWANAENHYLHVGFQLDHIFISEWQSIVEQKGHWILRGTIAEIGIGDGWLGAYLLQRDPALYYIGVDVSSVSREATEARLAAVDNNDNKDNDNDAAGRYTIVAPPADLAARNVDAVVSLKTIQHFPSSGYARRWFADVGEAVSATVLWAV